MSYNLLVISTFCFVSGYCKEDKDCTDKHAPVCNSYGYCYGTLFISFHKSRPSKTKNVIPGNFYCIGSNYISGCQEDSECRNTNTPFCVNGFCSGIFLSSHFTTKILQNSLFMIYIFSNFKRNFISNFHF